MERGERERWAKLSPLAKQLASIIAKCINAGQTRLSVNDLRLAGHWDSRTIMLAFTELAQRAYGRIDDETEANPIFVAIPSTFQTLQQVGLIPNGT